MFLSDLIIQCRCFFAEDQINSEAGVVIEPQSPESGRVRQSVRLRQVKLPVAKNTSHIGLCVFVCVNQQIYLGKTKHTP